MLRKTNHLLGAVAALALFAACGTDAVESKTNPASEEDDEADDSSDDSSDDDAPITKKDAGKPNTSSNKDAGAARADAGTGSGPKTDTPAAKGSIPCAVDKIIETNCRSCHGAKPAFTATFSLTTLASFQGASDTDPAKKMHEVALTRVSATDKKRMPPTSAKAIPAADLKVLTDWLSGGAQPGAACAGGEGPTGGDAGTGPVQTGDIPIAGPGGNAHATPLKYDDPDLKCYPLTAFTSGDRKKPYSVPTTPDLYVAFNMKAPWQGKQYVRSFRSIIDNSEVLHHWLLFKQSTGGSDSVQPNALGAHPDGIMLYGWAPGGDDLYMDSDVAMEVDGSVLYQLELHYNNKTGSAKPDASGVEMCVTPTKPAHVAGLSWVGTDAIAGTSATGRCAHSSSEPIHLIVAQPHMHTKGKHMKVVLTRKGGMKETIHDEPFDFNNQRSYIFNSMLINPGDLMETTCDYSSSAVFGKATNDEMCYFFSIHWPAGALSSLGTGTIIHGANSCM
jgi:hypothetical protein